MEYKNGRVLLSEDESSEILEEENNLIIDGKTYYLRPIDPNFKVSKGGNSSVYTIYDKYGDVEDRIIKICNIFRPSRKSPKNLKRLYGRFNNEISALYELKEEENVVDIYYNDFLELQGKKFPFYIMEKGEIDLKEYVSKEFIDNQEKVKFCLHIFKSLENLHKKGYYHRDIKPDNVYMFSSDGEPPYTWKIGDLGLINEREKDFDEKGEKIGPFGWISPEVMNKILTEKIDLGFDCKIDDKSDVFQLGMLFWFIFQNNVPLGIVTEEDFVPKIPEKETLFTLIEGMLQHSKPKRLNMEEIDEFLDEISLKFGV